MSKHLLTQATQHAVCVRVCVRAYVQVRLDGMQLENTIGYQQSTIRILSDTPLLAERNKHVGFSVGYWRQMGRMLDALAVVAFPTGVSVQFGDQAFRINITTILRNLGPIVAAKTGWPPPALPGALDSSRGARPDTARLPYVTDSSPV